jgi:hypothetical protein|tara:strand:+ start:2226 stop:2450 length:225 start_codon:yes stop_codon:yes gene_type:complete
MNFIFGSGWLNDKDIEPGNECTACDGKGGDNVGGLWHGCWVCDESGRNNVHLTYNEDGELVSSRKVGADGNSLK